MRPETIADKMPPQDLDAEQGLLGCCLIAAEPCSLLASVRNPTALFYMEAHRLIAEAAIALYQDGAPVDCVTVGAELRRRGKLEQVGGPEYLVAIVVGVPTSAHAKRYLDVLDRCRASRELIRLGYAALAAGFANPENPTAMAQVIAADMESETSLAGDFNLALAPLGDHIEGEVMPRVMDRAEAGGVPGIMTDWPVFNDQFCSGGLQPGRVSVIMAKRKVGKSTIASRLSLLAAKQAFPTAIWSGEMSKTEVSLKMIAQESGLSATAIELGRLTPQQREDFELYAHRVAALPIYVNQTRGLTVHGVLAWARRMKAKRGIRLLVVDYLQLLSEHLKRETMERNISDATRRFIVAAQELDVHVILTAQMNADGFAKWSGQTNDDAHFNWRVVRCDDKGNDEAEGEYMAFSVEQRFGRSGTVPRLYRLHGTSGRIIETTINPLPEKRFVPPAGQEGNPFDND
jgi:replicative DNA helicase